MARTTVEPPARSSPRRRSTGVAGLVGIGTAFAVLVAAGLTALTGARPAASLGLPDPGALTAVGLPAARAVAEVSMVVAIGALLLAAFLVAPQRTGYLDVSGYRAVRTASWAALAWLVAAALMVPLSVADALGQPVTEVLEAGLLLEIVPRLSGATAWLLSTLVAVVVLAGCRTTLSWGWTVVVFGLALLGPLPLGITGHSATGGAHDVATDSLVLHLLAASLWVGGLVAVVGLAASRAPDRAGALSTAVPRFSALALVCWAVLAVTGVANALVRLPLSEVFGSTYGALVLAKAGALAVLFLVGLAHRRATVSCAAAGDAGALLRLAGVEVLLMLGTIGLAVALGRTAPPPDTAAGPPSRVEALIGYDLTGPPTLLRLALDWRFDLLLGTGAIAAAVVYLLGVRRLRRRGDRWPVGRSVAWVGGCAAMLVATSSGIGRYGAAMFSVHMGEHMILSMLVPILLVIAAPVTLALRALPPAGRAGPPGPREWLLAAVQSPLARVLTHPLVSLPLFVGSYYVLYYSGLFAWALPQHWAHVAMNLHFMLVGVLFFYPIIGVDPGPRRLPPAARLGVLFASVPFHAFLGVALMSGDTVIGDSFYRSLALPWVSDPLRDQQLGGSLAWASGEVPLLIVVIVLLVQWARADERSARRDDRRADNDGDADLAAYNAMLRRLAGEGAPPVAARAMSSGSHGSGERSSFDAAGEASASPVVDASGVTAGHGPEHGSDEGPRVTATSLPVVAADGDGDGRAPRE